MTTLTLTREDRVNPSSSKQQQQQATRRDPNTAPTALSRSTHTTRGAKLAPLLKQDTLNAYMYGMVRKPDRTRVTKRSNYPFRTPEYILTHP